MSTLWDRFVDIENFHKAWDKVASNRGCAGSDRQTIRDFSSGLDRRLNTLRKHVINDTYRPLPLRQIWIPKSKTAWRELRVPTVSDRVVQQAMLNILHEIIEPQFSPSSFAYRPGRSHLMAVRKVEALHKRGYEWVLDADIVKFFDNLAHPRLYDEVTERLHQQRYLDLIERWISSSLLTKAGLIFPEKGVPQGAVITPPTMLQTPY
ncbi:MAG: reverse transcriptase domain-containing protein [Cyanobacteria bacterium P01_G01_bin.4]